MTGETTEGASAAERAVEAMREELVRKYGARIRGNKVRHSLSLSLDRSADLEILACTEGASVTATIERVIDLGLELVRINGGSIPASADDVPCECE